MASTQVVKLGPCGGGGGSEKNMDSSSITRIVKISVRHGVAIDNFAVRFVRNGREESTEQWGGQGGNLTEFNLQSTEFITAVKGYYGNFNGNFVVRSLKFVTNLGTFGPYGQEEGVPFELPAINGQIIGFHGRSGQLLDSIGVYVKVGGSSGGGSGGSTGPGTWQTGDTNFWDRPVSGA
ncbi:Mannose-binding lectin superfamily protein [Rhynchospora pubera]|uniref:Mannose-binding lectin superfamily protein n=1 Tax=Rhynchospora pubera TaxID=906938 RepID=A0AAV8E0X7_9POAL|nr:Mannose-binding lectin superfamily protein [Rhynchospora pubera]